MGFLVEIIETDSDPTEGLTVETSILELKSDATIQQETYVAQSLSGSNN